VGKRERAKKRKKERGNMITKERRENFTLQGIYSRKPLHFYNT
jgi:hypothetical protein